MAEPHRVGLAGARGAASAPSVAADGRLLRNRERLRRQRSRQAVGRHLRALHRLVSSLSIL